VDDRDVDDVGPLLTFGLLTFDSRDDSMLGLYVHIPFCSAICNYCNFNRGLFDAGLKDAYLHALVQEIERSADGTPADTIYFGGGTPSLLDPHEIARLVSACRDGFDVTADAEVSLEMNPETASRERLEGYRAAGVNRLSLGVQSLDDGELKRLGRIHDAARVRAAMGLARAAGFDNVSLDLMMWLPGQTVDQWLASVDGVIALAPDHASLYLLELYPNAPLREEMARSGWSQAPDEDAAEMYGRGLERFDRAGYTQYEISNVARPGRACRHNLKYWMDGEWLAFGCGAHATRDGRRWRNVSSTQDYVARISSGRAVIADVRTLSSQEHAEEALFTGLRLSDGIHLDEIRKNYGVDVWSRYGDALRPFVEAQVLEYTPPVLRLNRQGMLLANEVCSVFV
jgi:oxygen-independent coproporphyrinogen-3 oxidase